MKKIKIITFCFSLLLLPSISIAKVNKCLVDGKVIYQNSPCLKSEKDQEEQSYFGFDGWEFGTNIHEMREKAREGRLVMSPGTSTFISKYNEKILKSKPSSRTYTYRTKIMEKLTTVTLFYTKTSEKLYQVKVVFHVIQLKPEERKYFYEALYEKLSEKYGRAKNISREDVKNINKGLTGLITKGFTESMLGSLQAWGVGTANVVTLSFKKKYHLMSSYELTYKYVPLVLRNTKEITYDVKTRTKKSMSKDSRRL